MQFSKLLKHPRSFFLIVSVCFDINASMSDGVKLV